MHTETMHFQSRLVAGTIRKSTRIAESDSNLIECRGTKALCIVFLGVGVGGHQQASLPFIIYKRRLLRLANMVSVIDTAQHDFVLFYHCILLASIL